MDFKDLTIEDIENLPGVELVDTLFESMEQMKEIQIVHKDVTYLADDIEVPKFDKIAHFIDYKNQNEERWVLTFPLIDENNDPYYEDDVIFGRVPYGDEPEVGGFLRCFSHIEQKPLGLIEIIHIGVNDSRMGKNYSFINSPNGYEEFAYFIYDYEKNEYLQVAEEVLKRARKGDFKPDPENEAELLAVEYLRRLAIVETARGKFKSLFKKERYSKKHQKFIRDDYNKTDCKVTKTKDELGNLLKKPITVVEEKRFPSIQSILGFLERYTDYLYNDFLPWMKVKLLTKKINKEEYKNFVKVINTLVGENNKDSHKQKILNEIAKIFSSLKGTKEDRATYDLGLIVENDENYLSKSRIDKLLKTFTDYKSPKPENITNENNESLILQGFIYDEEKGELFPNFCEVERRRLRTKDFYSDREYELDQMKILENIKNFKENEKKAAE